MVWDGAVVVIPAHDEARALPTCLKAVVTAAACASVPVSIVVVLDSCTDESASLAGRFGADVQFVEVEARNVGAARAAGFTHARQTIGGDESRIWYATTDADSVVDPDWLIRQMGADADMVLGVVRVANWRQHSAASVRRYLAGYRAKMRRAGGGHDHVHGANMGFRADGYWDIGGFAALTSDEDVDLVRRFERAGRRIHRDAGSSVVTSARVQGRAPRGFASHLRTVSRRDGAA
ncbi:glycosyltransferase family 2 protein [Mycobacterium yunnanensis]|uniref:4,4'-diaponeurosporenoate glycosyltransferase n=1 Tax=Mycobacterium yunnanensis TaxID=368477 RepID=A0A9X3C019_9MYCO|nr:glycosyltransferase family 2 protein [Mycobacterium yunnanensis]MCV7419376.1 glycosyltransferase family 2 protein [Mycobacterium yunnanensis]